MRDGGGKRAELPGSRHLDGGPDVPSRDQMDSPARSGQALTSEPTSQANDVLMMPDRNQRRTIQVNRQYFEEHVHHRCIRLVKNGVVYIPRFKEEIARGVNYSLIRQDVSHVAGGDLADAGALVIVLTQSGLQSGSKIICQPFRVSMYSRTSLIRSPERTKAKQ